MPQGTVPLRTIGNDVGAVTALRQGDFECRDRVAVLLRPDEGEAFQFQVRGGFATARRFVILRRRSALKDRTRFLVRPDSGGMWQIACEVPRRPSVRDDRLSLRA